MATQTAEAEDLEMKIVQAASATEALARQYFGHAAYLRRDTAIDRETGEEDIVFEVHFCYPDPYQDFERLSALNQEFTSAFVRSVDGDVLHRIILRPVPSDAD